MQTVYSPRHAGHAGNVELMPGGSSPPSSCRGGPRSSWRGCGRSGSARSSRPSSTTSPRRGGCMRRTISTSCRAPGRCGGGGAGAARRCPSSGRCRACAPTCRPPTSTGCSASIAWTPAPPSSKAPGTRSRSSHDVALTAAGAGAGRGSGPPSRSAARRGTMPARASPAATASSTTPRWRRSGCGWTGAARVSVLDVDYHHGNGTQQIFYERGDVQVVNIHADPDGGVSLFPRARRRARRGRGRGLQPQPAAAARHRLRRLVGGAGDRLRGGRGLRAPTRSSSRSGSTPTAGDPISQFRLDTPDYPPIGAPHPRRSGCRRSS